MMTMSEDLIPLNSKRVGNGQLDASSHRLA